MGARGRRPGIDIVIFREIVEDDQNRSGLDQVSLKSAELVLLRKGLDNLAPGASSHPRTMRLEITPAPRPPRKRRRNISRRSGGRTRWRAVFSRCRACPSPDPTGPCPPQQRRPFPARGPPPPKDPSLFPRTCRQGIDTALYGLSAAFAPVGGCLGLSFPV